MSIAQVRANARKAVHDLFAVPVVYTPTNVLLTPFETTARLHIAKQPVESGSWSSMGYATMIEQSEYLIFNASEVTPVPGDVITLVDDPIEYRIDRVLPPYGGHVKCQVVSLL